MAKTTEQKVADALLERKIQVKVGAKVYEAPAPTIGTMVMVSELISELADVESKEDVAAMFRNFRRGRDIARICAIFILGAKAIRDRSQNVSSETKMHRIFLFNPRYKDPVEVLTDEILLNCTNTDISRIVSTFTEASNLDDFFELSTFLHEVNMTKPTKVENKTTASGQS